MSVTRQPLYLITSRHQARAFFAELPRLAEKGNRRHRLRVVVESY